MYSSYLYLRPIAIFAGIIGTLQGLTWMALSVTGITAYYCNFNFENPDPPLSSILELVFFRMYFQGSTCSLPALNFTALNNLNIMSPTDIHAWMWVYLVISFCWLISSLTLITNVTFEYIKYANIFLILWIIITATICILDLTIGILFGLDYNLLWNEASSLFLGSSGELVISNALTVSGIMMSIAFRGYLIWIVNTLLIGYFFKEIFQIYEYNKITLSLGLSNKGFVGEPHSILKTNPIDAYGYNNQQSWNNPHAEPIKRERARSFSGTPVYIEHKPRPPPFQYNQQPIKRSEPQQREDEVVIRRDTAASLAREIRDRRSYNDNGISNRPLYGNEINLPAPDYSPLAQRAFNNQPPLRSAIRNSRYQ